MSGNQARLVMAGIIAAILAVAFTHFRYYPVSVLSGERAVGTWISGFLLASCATLSLVLSMQRGPLPWLPFMGFFLILALDERFMFHENLKQFILFSTHPPRPDSSFMGELPVLLAGLGGAVVVFFFRKYVRRSNRVYLFLAAALGSLSVFLDLIHYHVVLEDLSKVLGELGITFCLLGEVRKA